MNIDRLIDVMIEADNNTSAYYKACNDYKKKYGFGAYIDMAAGLNPDKQHIVYMDRWMNASDEAARAVIDVLGLDREQTERLYAVAGAVKKWYERTNWERCIPSDLLDRIERYVFSA